MTKLSVNINKIATLRNARGGNTPNVKLAAEKCEQFGADGITIHPRPDERHIKYQDARDLKHCVQTEFNIEGYPGEGFLNLVNEVKPEQVTLVPDGPDVLTSNAGWDTIAKADFLRPIIKELKANGMRVSLFIECDQQLIEKAAELGADRIELYTEAYAKAYLKNREAAVAPYTKASKIAHACGLGVNAGHDLDQENLRYFAEKVPHLDEVSIGHALISEALYLGLENTIQLYQKALGK